MDLVFGPAHRKFGRHLPRNRFQSLRTFWLGDLARNLDPCAGQHGRCDLCFYWPHGCDADQPASSAGIVNPTFQGSVHFQGIRLTEGDRSAQTATGGPGSFGLVIKRPRRPRAFQLGLTPLTSKAFNVSRSLTDSTLGNINETYEGQGGLARAYVGLSRGWRGRSWRSAGKEDSVLVNTWGLDAGIQADHWFGDAIQNAFLDIEDATFRDVRTSVSSRHRASGVVFGAEGYTMLRVNYNDSKDFEGSWMLKLGGTWSPARTLSTDFTHLVKSTVLFNGIVSGWTRRPLNPPFSKERFHNNGRWVEAFNGMGLLRTGSAFLSIAMPKLGLLPRNLWTT